MNNIDKLLEDMDALCQTTAKEREERYRESCRAAKISEWSLSDENTVIDGDGPMGAALGTTWREQQLTDEEMAMIRSRRDQAVYSSGKHQDHMMFVFDEGSSWTEVPYYCKTCEETLQDMIGELQDMIEFIESMDLIEGCGIDDILNQLNASISAYNEGI